MTKSQSEMGAAFEAHYVKQFAEAEKVREATKDDPDLPKVKNFHEASGRMIEQAIRVSDYKRSNRDE